MFRSINERVSPVKKKLSSFTKKEGVAQAEVEADFADDNCEFKDSDIDEQSSPASRNKTTKISEINRPFVPRILADRKLPATPGFNSKNSLSYLKSIGTPMQSRRVINKPKKIPEKKASGKSSYFKRIAEATKNEPKLPPPEIKLFPGERNDPEFQTALSHTLDEPQTHNKIQKPRDSKATSGKPESTCATTAANSARTEFPSKL